MPVAQWIEQPSRKGYDGGSISPGHTLNTLNNITLERIRSDFRQLIRVATFVRTILTLIPLDVQSLVRHKVVLCSTKKLGRLDQSLK